MEQFQIRSRLRHIRYVIFVADNYPYEKLLDLIHTNQKLWGGRYNPIVPVKDNVISQNWQTILSHYDPDFILYTEEISPETIKRLRIFNPCRYININESTGTIPLSGVDSYHLLSEYPAKTNLIQTHNSWDLKNPLRSYFETNFGITDSTEYLQTIHFRNFNTITVNNENFDTLNKLIKELKPINLNTLSTRNINTVILRSKNDTSTHPFEIVIAKDTNSNTDLFYYWNRMLFEIGNIMYLTLAELNELCRDIHFVNTLENFDGNWDWRKAILVTSQSLSKEELDNIIDNQLNKLGINKRFDNGRIESFPFEVLDANGYHEDKSQESFLTQTIHTRYGLLNLPLLSFANKIVGPCALDININEITDGKNNNYLFPLTTDPKFIIKGVHSRIDKKRTISALIPENEDSNRTLEIFIPSFRELLHQLIKYPRIDSVVSQTKFLEIGLHDVSYKLEAFLKAFQYDLRTIQDFFEDHFWVDIFENLSTSKKVIGDSISFEEILYKCRNILRKQGLVSLDANGHLEGKKGETYKNDENLQLGLKKTIEELCSYKVLFKGFNLKCTKCSSHFWYHINEVKDLIECKGCLEKFNLPIESKFFYRLNDLIKNNLFIKGEKRDGNITVIRTLATIQASSVQSFYYSPQLNLYDNLYTNKACADIDIVCLSDGKFIIGEAKHDSKLFFENNSKSLKSLVELSKLIRPEKIVLACYVNSNDKLGKAHKSLIHMFNNWTYQPEIITIGLPTPDYWQIEGHRYFYH